MSFRPPKFDALTAALCIAFGSIGILAGVVIANRCLITLKPEFSMDGIATLATGLILVIVLSIAAVNKSEHRRSAVELLTEDIRDVTASAREIHDSMEGIQSEGSRPLSSEEQRKFMSLKREYSNSLSVVQHSISLCNFNVSDALKQCELDRRKYTELVFWDPFPIAIEPETFRAEPGQHTSVQQNLRTLLYRIGQR